MPINSNKEAGIDLRKSAISKQNLLCQVRQINEGTFLPMLKNMLGPQPTQGHL
mgnify:CR=1 FL=1